jgi:alpha-N-arabinofuranosidase
MQLAHYTLKHNQVAQAMWSVDPTLKLVGVGELGRVNRRHDPDEKRGWSEGMLEDCAEHMNALSEHFYVYSTQGDPAKHAAQMVNAIRGKASGMRELHKRLESLQGRTVPISMDEWNYWYSDYVYGELGCVYRHRDALGVAAGLHEYFRNSDIIQMANYAQTVNVIGCIKTTRTQAFFSTTALPLMLYRHHYGEIPIEVVHEAAPLDVVAAWTADRKAVTVGVVNPTWDTYRVSFSWSGVRPATRARGWMITAESPLEFNTAAAPANVAITEADLVDLTGTVEVGPLTNALYQAPVE